MNTPRKAELSLEARERVAELVARLDEYAAARGAGGTGTHRDPSNVYLEAREEADDLRATLRALCDEFEREARDLRP